MGMDELRAAVMYLIISFLVGHNFNYDHRKKIGIKSARLERDTGEAFPCDPVDGAVHRHVEPFSPISQARCEPRPTLRFKDQ